MIGALDSVLHLLVQATDKTPTKNITYNQALVGNIEEDTTRKILGTMDSPSPGNFNLALKSHIRAAGIGVVIMAIRLSF